MTATILEARGLTKSFAGPPLFSGLTVTVSSGLTAVAGKNGSGKTTLLKILGSLLRPQSGSLRVLRGNRALAGHERRLAVGWAGPDLEFYEELTATENLAFFLRASGSSPLASAIGERLAAVGLTGAPRRVAEFSTGMKQRLRLAFAFLFDAPIVLLDEPMAGLDEEGRSIVRGLVERHRRSGAVVLASNDERDFVNPEQTVTLGREAGSGKR